MALSKKRAASVALHSIGGCPASEKLHLVGERKRSCWALRVGMCSNYWRRYCVSPFSPGLEWRISFPRRRLRSQSRPRPQGEHYHVLGTRYQGILAGTEIKVDLRLTDGAKENLRLLNDPNSGIQIGFMQGGISNSRLAPDLMSLGRIDHQIFWLFYPYGETLTDLSQLKGKRIGLRGRGQRRSSRVRKNSCRCGHNL